MASRADIEAGKSFVRLFLKDDMLPALKKSLSSVGPMLKETGAQVMKVGAAVTAAGVGILAPLAGAVKHFVSVGDALGDMSDRTGIAAGVLAELGHAATQTGADMADVEIAIKSMQRKIGAAKPGSDLFGLKGLNPEEQFQRLADSIAAIEDPTDRAAKAMEVFGKSGSQIVPMLTNLRALREEARAEGLIPSEEAVKAAGELDNAFNKLKAAVSSLVFEIGASLADEVLAFVQIAKETIKTVRDWIKENTGLVKIAAAVGVGLVVAGAAITAFGGAMVTAGIAASGLATAIGFIVSPLGLVVAGIAAVTAALTAGIAWWVKFTESGKATVKVLKEVFGGIFDALKAGKWALAGEIAMAALKLAWVKGTVELEQIWADLVHAIKSMWTDAMASLSNMFFALVDEVKSTWNDLFPDIPIGGGAGAPKEPDDGHKALDDEKKKADDARAKRIDDAKRALADLIAKARAIEAGGGFAGGGAAGGMVGGGGISGNKPSELTQWFRGNVKNVITNSGAAAAAAGYMGGVRNPSDPYTKAIMKIEKKLEEEMRKAAEDRKKMLTAMNKIAEGLHYG